jgi:hypothetical protein
MYFLNNSSPQTIPESVSNNLKITKPPRLSVPGEEGRTKFGGTILKMVME